jgi:regulator of sigma E protease
MTILISILAFIVTIGILVTIHEYGHFWVARKLGVKILRFSVGFGKPLWKYVSNDKDKTEYVLAAIPFGGFVRMLDEREGEVEEYEKHRAFNRQKVWKRFAIVLAGPLFNFIFAIFAYFLMYMVGVEAIQPYVGKVIENSPAAEAGFQHKDKITAINGKPVPSLTEATLLLLDEYLKDPKHMSVSVTTAEGKSRVRQLDLSGVRLLKDEKDYLEKVGFTPWFPYKPAVGKLMEGKPAALAGFKVGDILLEVNGNKLETIEDFVSYVNAQAGNELSVLVERENKNGNSKKLTLTVTPELGKYKGKPVGQIGIAVGRKVSDEDIIKLRTMVSYPVARSLQQGAKKTWQMSTMTLKVMGRLVTGDASLKNISGPITIANYAGKSALLGISAFLGFLAIVSVSLGVLNLLPIPMLDGGHLFYYIIEIIKGSPVSDGVQEIGLRIGLTLVGSLMIMAFYFDIMRLFN